MWTASFTDELSVLYKQAGVDEELPTSNMDKVHEVLGGRNTAVNFPDSDSGDPVCKYFGKVERNFPTNNAAESVQPGIERNLPTNNAAESVHPPVERGLADNYMGKSAGLGSLWKSTKELPEAWRAARSARKTYSTASKVVREKGKSLKQPVASSTYRKAKLTKDEALTAWGEAGKRVAKGLVIPGGVATAGVAGGVAYKSRKK